MKHTLSAIAFAGFAMSASAATLPKLPHDFSANWDIISLRTCIPKNGVVLVKESYREKGIFDGSIHTILLGKKNNTLVTQIEARVSASNVVTRGYVLNNTRLYTFDDPFLADFEKFSLSAARAYGLTKAEYAICSK